MNKKIIYIAWSSPRTRAIELSKHFSGELFAITEKKRIPAILRYIILSIKTIKILTKEKPQYVIVQVPPILVVFLIYIYVTLFSGKYILDVHSGEVLDFKWKPFKIIRKFFFKRAFWVLFHNDSNYNLIKKLNWKCKAIILNDPVPEAPKEILPIRTCKECRNVIIISAFDKNEPYYECFEAADILSKNDNNWFFTFTGNSSKIRKEGLVKNIRFTGFIDYNEYWSILKGADVIISLNKRDGVITCGLWEGVALGKPTITNDYETIKKIFKDSVIYSKNDSISIAKAIKRAYLKKDLYSKRIKKTKENLKNNWISQFLIVKKSIELK